MCGIVYIQAKGKKKVSGNDILKAYENQKERGQDSFGIATPGKILLKTRSEGQMREKLFQIHNKYKKILFHHRKTTSGGDGRDQTHPFLYKDWIFCGNGTAKDHEIDKWKKKYNISKLDSYHKITKFLTRRGESKIIESKEKFVDTELLGRLTIDAIEDNKQEEVIIPQSEHTLFLLGKGGKVGFISTSTYQKNLDLTETDDYICLSSKSEKGKTQQDTFYVNYINSKGDIKKDLKVWSLSNHSQTYYTSGSPYHSQGKMGFNTKEDEEDKVKYVDILDQYTEDLLVEEIEDCEFREDALIALKQWGLDPSDLTSRVSKLLLKMPYRAFSQRQYYH